MSDLYVFDTNSISVFGNYYPDSFPSFWEHLSALVEAGGFVSCREVRKELERRSPSQHVNDWVDGHVYLFSEPSVEEMHFVAAIFKVKHFRQLISQKRQLTGAPVADPFIVARGAVRNGCVVTEEARKPNAAKVPNVCDHFGVACTTVQGFLGELGWQF
jgi:hypothetical protein